MSTPRAARIKDLRIERMLETRSVAELDQSLFELAWEARLAPALSLWRKVPSGAPRIEEGWHPLRSRGAVELLPIEPMVRAVLEGGIDERLPGGSMVLSACVGPRCVALVLAGSADEDSAMIGSALLSLHAVLAGPALDPNAFGAALPSSEFDAPDDEPRI